MTFHEEYKKYEEAGLEHIDVMLELSKEGVRASDAKSYTDAGYNTIDDILHLNRIGIDGGWVKTLNGFGFSADIDTAEKLSDRFKGEYSMEVDSLKQYVEAGFYGDAKAILELNRKNKYDVPAVKPEFALFLAEHGLKGDKKAMLDIPNAIGCDTLKQVAYRIAFRLSDESMSYKEFRHLGIQSDGFDYEYADNLRKKFAEKISASNLVLLVQHNLGEEEAEDSHPIEKEIKSAYKRKYAFERAGKEKAVTEMEQEIKRLYEISRDKYDERARLKDDKLMEAYTILMGQGEDAFKSKYTPNEGWVDNEKGSLRYNPVIASKLQRKRWNQHEKELRGLD